MRTEESTGRGRVSKSDRDRFAASDALRAIEKYSGIVPAELTEIRRQNPALGKTVGEKSWIMEYRAAVAEAQAGDLHPGPSENIEFHRKLDLAWGTKRTKTSHAPRRAERLFHNRANNRSASAS